MANLCRHPNFGPLALEDEHYSKLKVLLYKLTALQSLKKIVYRWQRSDLAVSRWFLLYDAVFKAREMYARFLLSTKHLATTLLQYSLLLQQWYQRVVSMPGGLLLSTWLSWACLLWTAGLSSGKRFSQLGFARGCFFGAFFHCSDTWVCPQGPLSRLSETSAA